MTFNQLLNLDSPEAAPKLLGSILEIENYGKVLRAKIVETEAYYAADAASHSYKGITNRTKIMFGPPGFLYVYFTYGMHYCANIVVAPQGVASAVLIRAVEPLNYRELLRDIRQVSKDINLTNGPAKFASAYGIDKSFNGHDLRNSPIKLIIKPELATKDIVTTTRIGISQAKDEPLRFYISGNPYVSKL